MYVDPDRHRNIYYGGLGNLGVDRALYRAQRDALSLWDNHILPSINTAGNIFIKTGLTISLIGEGASLFAGVGLADIGTYIWGNSLEVLGFASSALGGYPDGTYSNGGALGTFTKELGDIVYDFYTQDIFSYGSGLDSYSGPNSNHDFNLNSGGDSGGLNSTGDTIDSYNPEYSIPGPTLYDPDMNMGNPGGHDRFDRYDTGRIGDPGMNMGGGGGLW